MAIISVSQAARILNISRREIQDLIVSGKLSTHEGYVTRTSLKEAFPTIILNFEDDEHIRRIKRIKEAQVLDHNSHKIILEENELVLGGIIDRLKSSAESRKIHTSDLLNSILNGVMVSKETNAFKIMEIRALLEEYISDHPFT